jgi:hypothetical protein
LTQTPRQIETIPVQRAMPVSYRAFQACPAAADSISNSLNLQEPILVALKSKNLHFHVNSLRWLP